MILQHDNVTKNTLKNEHKVSNSMRSRIPEHNIMILNTI